MDVTSCMPDLLRHEPIQLGEPTLGVIFIVEVWLFLVPFLCTHLFSRAVGSAVLQAFTVKSRWDFDLPRVRCCGRVVPAILLRLVSLAFLVGVLSFGVFSIVQFLKDHVNSAAPYESQQHQSSDSNPNKRIRHLNKHSRMYITIFRIIWRTFCT